MTLRSNRIVARALNVAAPRILDRAPTQWTLMRAYAATGSELSVGDATTRYARACSLRMATRIAARLGTHQLDRELGTANATHCREQLQGQVVHGLVVVRMIEQCLGAASEMQIDVMLLKFAALHEYGFVTVSTRPVADLDVLVDPSDVERLTAALVQRGATRLEKWVPSHHPAVLRSKFGKNIEIHTRLPHVRAKGERGFVSLASLRTAGALVPCRGAGSHLFLPRRDLLVGHLIAHALVTHAYAPAAYPVLRILGDVIDAGLAEDEQLAMDAAEWIGAYVPLERVVALRELAMCCKSGDVVDLFDGDTAAAGMLRHLIGSTIDEGYRRKLRRRRIIQVFDEVGFGETLRHIFRRIRRDWVSYKRSG